MKLRVVTGHKTLTMMLEYLCHGYAARLRRHHTRADVSTLMAPALFRQARRRMRSSIISARALESLSACSESRSSSNPPSA